MSKDDEGQVQNHHKYVLTPGLSDYFTAFLDHYKAAGNSPIMIVGPTGAGKSLFLYAIEKLYQDEFGQDKDSPPVVWANCAHFGGVQSDPNIARSEIFGHVKGSYSGATKKKSGLVEEAQDGLLILEEIGELPLEVQAMLLTFIETGEYRPLGGIESRYASVRIAGATNHEDDLRLDFRYRFFPFYLPGIHHRRRDILYYLHALHPDLIPTLTRNEILPLLAYHWPGNVREIDRVARLMIRDKFSSQRYTSDERYPADNDQDVVRHQSRRIYRIDGRYTEIAYGSTDAALHVATQDGGDGKLLEKIMNRFGLSLTRESVDQAFPDPLDNAEYESQFLIDEDLKDTLARFGIKKQPRIKQFDRAFEGYLAFCGLFMQYPFSEGNILRQLKDGDILHLDLDGLDFLGKDRKKVPNLVKSIMNFIKGIYIPDYPYPKELDEYWEVLETQLEQHGGSAASCVSAESKVWDSVLNMPESELLKKYYEGLLRQSRYKIRYAATKAGMKETTFRSRLDKYKVSYKKSD